MKNLVFLFILSALFISCEEVMVNVPDPKPPETEKIVLVEELTGATCPNCPKGAAALESILEFFEGSVVAVGIHGVQQAAPVPNLSKYDFRNPAAVELEESFAPFLGKPSAVINRVKFDDQQFVAITGTDVWSNYVEQELQRASELNLFIAADYDTNTRAIDIEVTVNGVRDLVGDYLITVLITQSHIIDAQEDVSEIIEEFEFNHVLMDAVTDPLGDPFRTEITPGEIITQNYTYTLPEEDGLWVAEDMEIVAFVHNVDVDDSRVIQANMIKLSE